MMHLLSMNNKVHSSRISQRLQRPPLFLEDFDLIVLKSLADGLHTDEICLELNTSKSTIERHKRKLKEQLGDEFTTDCGLLGLLYPYGYQFFKLNPEYDSKTS